MQEAIPCLCLSSPELGKESTFSCWSLNHHLLEELGQGVLPSCCTCCLQEAEDWRVKLHHPTELGQGGSAVPKVLWILTEPQTATQCCGGCSNHLSTAQCPHTTLRQKGKRRKSDPKVFFLSQVGEQTKEARHLAETLLTSWPGKGNTNNLRLLFVWLVSFTSTARAGERTVAGSHSGRAEQRRFLFQDKPQHLEKEDSVTLSHEGR